MKLEAVALARSTISVGEAVRGILNAARAHGILILLADLQPTEDAEIGDAQFQLTSTLSLEVQLIALEAAHREVKAEIERQGRKR